MLFWPVLHQVQINSVFTDNVCILCYRFLSPLYIYQVSGKLYLDIYNKTLSSQCKLTTQIEPMQAKMFYGCFVPAIRNGRLFYALKSRNMASAFVTLSVKLQIVFVFSIFSSFLWVLSFFPQ